MFEPAVGDYHLATGSPGLDHGPDPSLYDGLPCLDRDGDQRLLDYYGEGLAQVDVGAYEHSDSTLSPGTVAGVLWTDNQTLTWTTPTGALQYDIYRADVSVLGFDNYGTCRNDLDLDLTDLELVDPNVPLLGQAWFYLITADDGTEGSLGLGTCAERSNYNLASCLP